MRGTVCFTHRKDGEPRRSHEVKAEISYIFGHYVPHQEHLFIYGFVEHKGMYKKVRLEGEGKWYVILHKAIAQGDIESHIAWYHEQWAFWPV
jgi:hypothetical protein